jgi:hypothetical protein
LKNRLILDEANLLSGRESARAAGREAERNNDLGTVATRSDCGRDGDQSGIDSQRMAHRGVGRPAAVKT